MAKDTFYFKHDMNSRNDPKLLKLKKVLGSAGKGIYWDIIEMLHEQGGKLPYDIEDLAYNINEDKSIVEKVVNDFQLFKKSKKQFWSDRVVKNLEERTKIVKAARGAASKRWGIDANALPTHSERNARKGKERKGEKRIVFTAPTIEDVFFYFQERQTGIWSEHDIEFQANKFYDRNVSAGWKVGKNPMKDWKAAIRTWCNNNYDQCLNIQGNGATPPPKRDMCF